MTCDGEQRPGGGPIMARAFWLEERDDRLAVLTLDLPGKKVNTLGRDVLDELGRVLDTLGNRADLRGLLFRSGKAGQFLAGADLAALADASRQEAATMIGLGKRLFEALADLPFPTVALIDGPGMGGGFELALAMDERVVSREVRTQVALPEVKIGLIPAWGGTQRLPRLIGLGPAIEMITSGDPASAEQAVGLGLACASVPADLLPEQGARVVEDLRRDDRWRVLRDLRRSPLIRDAAFPFVEIERAILSRTRAHEPAPLAALKAIREGAFLPWAEALAVETVAALEVFGSPVASNLIGVFFAKSRLGRDPGPGGAAVTPRPVRRVGVLGAGRRGARIASACARFGLTTVLIDTDEGRVAGGFQRARLALEALIAGGLARAEDLANLQAGLSCSTSLDLLRGCDLVVEAVTEDEAVKVALFGTLGGVLEPGTILASSTSTLSITRLAESAPDPNSFLGMHFVPSDDRMELVEVVRGDRTGDEAAASVASLARRLRKVPMFVRDRAGFLVNRVLFPFLNEAILLLGEGVLMDAIDAEAEQFGMTTGPIALLDEIGLDVAATVGRALAEAYPGRAFVPPLLVDLVAAGRLGKQSGAGFRKHERGTAEPEADAEFSSFLEPHRTPVSKPDAGALLDRLMLPMLLEATRVLEDGVVREPADLDIGLILGIGFPPFRGGILRWADAQGAADLIARLDRSRCFGERLRPTEMLLTQARAGSTFYPPRTKDG